MASRHHHPCSRRQNIPLFTTSSRCCTYGDSTPPCCTNSNHPPPLPDNLLHLLASYLQTQQKGTNFPDQNCSCKQKNVPREHDQVILSCLLRKIDDLESSLNKFASFYDQRRERYSTLRDSAARVIQTHFRSYLVQRSISFRYLKELAMIKSSFLSLKSSVSRKPIFPYKVVSRKATDLLLQLDSIQGRIDPMIRSSKRSLSRDLVRFLQYVDDCVVRRYGYVSKSAANMSFVGSHSKDRRVEKLRNRTGKVFVACDGDEELESMTDDSEEVSVDKRKTGGSSKFRTRATVKSNIVKPPVRKIMVPHGSEELDSTTDDSEDVPTDKRKTCDSSKFRTGGVVKGNVVKHPVRRTMVMDKNRNVYGVYGNKHDVTSSGEDDSVDSGEEESVVVSRDNDKKRGSRTRNMVLVKGSGDKSRVVKTVSFDENGNVYKVYGDTPEASISEEDDSTSGSNDGDGDKKGNGNEVEEIKYVPKENEGFEVEEGTQSENEVSSSDGSEGDSKNANTPGSNEHNKKREIQLQKGNSMFSPPLPLKMEP